MKVTLRLWWVLGLMFISLILGGVIFAWASGEMVSDKSRVLRKITKKYDVRRGVTDTAYGTYWRYCGGWFTADHVHRDMGLQAPDFVRAPVIRSGGLIDAVWYGKKWRCKAPEGPKEGMDVYVLGYPSGTDTPTLRQGQVYFRRKNSGSPGYVTPTWIVTFPPRDMVGISGEPVVGGMSGGIVTNMQMLPVGILVAQNSPSDLNGDGRTQQSADIVGLDEAYQMLIK